MANFTSKFSPPGKQITVNGHKMHIYCMGKNKSHTVIMDAGVGRFSLDFVKPMIGISKFASVCAFDRAGYGWSEPSPLPRTSKNIINEMAELLKQAGKHGPYILVGHSGGGMYVRIFAHYYPEKVAGLILIDSAAVPADSLPELKSFQKRMTYQFQIMKIIAYVKFFNFLGLIDHHHKYIPSFIKKIDPSVQQAYIATLSQPAYYKTILDELSHFDHSSKEVWQQLNHIQSLGNIPLVILSSDYPLNMKNGMTRVSIEKINRYLKESQKKLLSLSSRSIHIAIPESTHDIHLDYPQAIVDAVQKIIEMQ